MQNLGSIALFTGNVTSLDKLPLSPSELAESIGLGVGRLAQGYWILLLKQQLTIDDFELDGLTLRSGGRAGLPADTWEAEPLRPRERDRMLADYGPEGYRHRKQHALGIAKTTGKQRIAKVCPVTRFNENDGSLKDQFPPGWGAGLQWDIVRKCRFLVALKVDSDGIATAPTFSARLVPLVSQDREKIARYLSSA